MRYLKMIGLAGLAAGLSANANAVVIDYDMLGYNTSQSVIIHTGSGGGSGEWQWRLGPKRPQAIRLSRCITTMPTITV